jgi:pyruvate,water dikinase
MSDRLGGKNANLGEVGNRVHLPTPEGFAISSYAFKRFMEHNNFLGILHEKMADLSVEDLDKLNETSAIIREMIIGAEMPADLLADFDKSVELLKKQTGHSTIMVSVRSSALQEDGEFSFAGQYATCLNVPAEAIPLRYKEVISSLFTSRALFYFKTKGLQEYDMVMSVGVLRMIDARAAGVIYSRDPNTTDSDDIIVSAVRGLGKCLVDGTMTPETFTVSKSRGLEIIGRTAPTQNTMLICKDEGSLDEISVTGPFSDGFSISDEEIRVLAGYAAAIENHYGCPQDIEWAIDREGRPFILQTRPLRMMAKEAPRSIPTRMAGYNILIDRGIIACKGIGYGKAYIVGVDEDLKGFPEGAVLVARHTSPKYVTVMSRAAAIVTDFGGATGHMASLAREFQVPAILDTEIGTETLRNGQEITVDAYNCNVYEGKVDELIELAGKRENPFKETQIFKTLQKVLKWIVPLNLTDPEAGNFRAESCETIHDITRFCHEIAMNEMFSITSTPAHEIGETRKLIAGIPLISYIIDLGGGISENAPNTLNPEHITSEPLKSFFRGLVAMRWPQGKPLDAKGFLGMMAHTASIPEEELQKTGEKSFSFISGNYMNFVLRLGYHLSTVEAFAGENLNDNYIRFFFKGGGAGTDRKLRRVRLIAEIMRSMDFRVKVVEDVVDAMLTKYKRPMIEEKLEILGRFTVYTKQLDMVMYNDAVTDFYIDEFISKYVRKKKPEEKSQDKLTPDA